MPGEPSKHPWPLGSLTATPDDVLTRLRQRLLPVASVWFPTPRELRAWSSAGVPLYVRELGSYRVEVGPRLASLWAACFAPVWVLRMSPDGAAKSHLNWHRRPVRFTLGLLVGWWAILAAWPVALYASPDPDEPGRWLVFWAFLVVASTVGPGIGWILGGQALDEAQAWLQEALTQPDVDEDW